MVCRCISYSVLHFYGLPWLAALLPGAGTWTVCVSWINHCLAFMSTVQRYLGGAMTNHICRVLPNLSVTIRLLVFKLAIYLCIIFWHVD